MMRPDNRKRDYTLYVLECEDGKYYVGVTSNTVEERFRQHQWGKMSAYWTQRYKPLRIIESQVLGNMTYSDAEIIENRRTRELMDEKGLNNVRGGDLKADEVFIGRFGRIHKLSDWETITTIVFLLVVIVYFAVDKYFVSG